MSMVKANDNYIFGELKSKKIDVCALVETWLSDKDADCAWERTCELNINEYRFKNISRKHDK